MTDITFGHQAGHTPPVTMDHPSQWHYVATRLMAHMGAYSPDKMNRLHRQPHQRAALRMRAAMQGHNIWDIPGSRDYQQHASGHGRSRSEEVRSSPGRGHAVNLRDATRGHTRSGFLLWHVQKPPPTVRPVGGTKAVLTPQGCKAACRSGSRRQGTLAAPGAAAARRLPQHAESSSTRIWTEAMEVQRTSTPSRHHLPPIPDAGSRGPAPNGRISPPFPHQPSESDRQRLKRTPTGQQTERPARPPPPCQVRRPARCRGDSTPRTHGQEDPRPTNGLHKGRGDNPPNAPARERGAVTPVADTGTGHPTSWACTPRGSSPQLQHSQTTGARRTHRDNGSTTRAAQERTKK